MRYEDEFKEEALQLSDRIGVKRAAAELGISCSTLSRWRANRRSENVIPFSGGSRQVIRDKEELQRLKFEKMLREVQNANAILEEALASLDPEYDKK